MTGTLYPKTAIIETVFMTGEKTNRFDMIAVEMNYLDQETIDKAVVVQARICEKTEMCMPIDEILIEMGAITSTQRSEILEMQQKMESEMDSASATQKPPIERTYKRSSKQEDTSLNINVSKDKLIVSVFIDGEIPVTAFDVDDVKTMLDAEGIVHGIVDDAKIKAFLNGDFSVGKRWTIATGTDAIPDSPPQINVEGDLTTTNGIFGATVRCGGNMKAGHIHNANIIVDGNIAVEKEIFESTIETNGRCLINDGIIISSMVCAKMGISVMDIGKLASKSSELVVGIDQQVEREIDTAKLEIQAIKAEHDKLRKLLENHKKRSAEVNDRLGEVAQAQDKCMVQQRRLQEKIDAGLLKQDGSAAIKLQRTIADLKADQDAYDQDVAQLMETDESIAREISVTETAIIKGYQKIRKLSARLETLTADRKTNRGLAVVKIGGNLFAENRITGPHSSLLINENHQRLTIAETNEPDHDGVKRWRFELNPFR